MRIALVCLLAALVLIVGWQGLWIQNLRTDRDRMERDIDGFYRALAYTQQQVKDLQHPGGVLPTLNRHN